MAFLNPALVDGARILARQTISTAIQSTTGVPTPTGGNPSLPPTVSSASPTDTSVSNGTSYSEPQSKREQ